MPNEIISQAETTTDKSLIVDGRKLWGVKAVVFTYAADNVLATATVTMHIKRGSVVITDKEITFSTPAKKDEPLEVTHEQP